MKIKIIKGRRREKLPGHGSHRVLEELRPGVSGRTRK